MAEKFTPHYDRQSDPKTKKNVNTKNLNGFWSKSVNNIRIKVEKMNKPEAKAFFDFWRLITQQKPGKKELRMKSNLNRFYNNEINEFLQNSTYQTFKGNTLTIVIGTLGDANGHDKEFEVGPQDLRHPNQTLYVSEEDKSSETETIDPTYQYGELKLQLLSNGTIKVFSRDYIRNGIRAKSEYDENARERKWEDQGTVSGTQAELLIKQLQNKFLDRYVTSDIMEEPLDRELQRLIDQH